MALITVGLPFTNDAATLPLAISSVLAQSLEDWHLVLIDDGSDDGSLEIAHAVDDPRVTVISDGMNVGLGQRLNQIAAIADTPFVARLDADDAMLPNRLAVQSASFLDNPNLEALATAAFLIDADNTVVGVNREAPLPRQPSAFLDRRSITHPSLLARAAWLRAHPYDGSFRRAQDQELWCRAYSASTFARLEVPLTFLRRVGNVTWRKYRLSRKYERRVVRLHGPRMVGYAASARLLATNYAKVGAFGALSACRLADRLLASRADALPDAARVVAQRELDALLLASHHRFKLEPTQRKP